MNQIYAMRYYNVVVYIDLGLIVTDYCGMKSLSNIYISSNHWHL